MKTAFVIFDGMTSLDFVGVFDPLGRLQTMGYLADFRWTVCSFRSPVVDDRGLTFLPDEVGQSLSGFDMLVVPGGFGTRELQVDAEFLGWLKTAKEVPLKASVCTGSLLLGAAGFLTVHDATTHPNSMQELAQYCARTRTDRVVDAGDVVTARGVTSAIDLGLYLIGRIADAKAQREIAAQMDYPHFGKM